MQRQVIATQLLVTSARTLADHGIAELRSQCNLGNEASMAWHAQCGFTEIPSHVPAGHRANIYLQEAERQEQLQLSTAPATRDLAEYWAEVRDRLDPWTQKKENRRYSGAGWHAQRTQHSIRGWYVPESSCGK